MLAVQVAHHVRPTCRRPHLHMQSMSAEQLRSLAIKKNAVKRTTKEYLYYFKEKDAEEGKLAKMRADGADTYDIKQQENVVQESTVMIPERRKSLEGLLADLRSALIELGDDLAADAKEREDAQAVVAEAEAALSG